MLFSIRPYLRYPVCGVARYQEKDARVNNIISAIIALASLTCLATAAWPGYIDGLDAYVLGDYENALREFRRSAEQGHPGAQFELAYMYAKGQAVPRNDAEAAKWYRKAAEQGYAEAQLNLALMYDKGEGLRQDYAEAAKWFRKAAEKGVPQAQINLGWKYEKGHGVPQDYVQAHMWYNLAGSHDGYESGAKLRDLLAKQMTSLQVTEAQQLAREWMKKH